MGFHGHCDEAASETGGLERYFEEIAPILSEKGPEWTQRYRAAAEAYGLEILDDWSDELKARYGITL